MRATTGLFASEFNHLAKRSGQAKATLFYAMSLTGQSPSQHPEPQALSLLKHQSLIELEGLEGEMKKKDEKAESIFGELLEEIPEFRDPLKAVAESAKETMRK
uniref:Uncharacterized protein n=1 Tax=Candidatus Methanophaga sp. ANME-1 ERB7 TaxID=2759913 RepID=A0A7G9ZBH4_9EURY|nr:hypothetical protein LCMFKOLL_00004 [Methanosarcinales archaeon ANME-1 ERB7]